MTSDKRDTRLQHVLSFALDESLLLGLDDSMSVRKIVVPANDGGIAGIENEGLSKIRFAFVFGVWATNVHFATFSERQRNDGRVRHKRLGLVAVIRNVVVSVLVTRCDDVIDVERLSIDGESVKMTGNLMNDGQRFERLIAGDLSVLKARKRVVWRQASKTFHHVVRLVASQISTTIIGDGFGSINPIAFAEKGLKSRSGVDAALLHKIANDTGASEEGLDDERMVVVKNGGHLELKQKVLTITEKLNQQRWCLNGENSKREQKKRPRPLLPF